MHDPCDPVFAFVRCWEHSDCLEHPELAMACGPKALSLRVDTFANVIVGDVPDFGPLIEGSGDGVGEFGSGDGDGFRRENGDGWGVGNGDVHGGGRGMDAGWQIFGAPL